jgi:hypothetical protein
VADGTTNSTTITNSTTNNATDRTLNTSKSSSSSSSSNNWGSDDVYALYTYKELDNAYTKFSDTKCYNLADYYKYLKDFPGYNKYYVAVPRSDYCGLCVKITYSQGYKSSYIYGLVVDESKQDTVYVSNGGAKDLLQEFDEKYYDEDERKSSVVYVDYEEVDGKHCSKVCFFFQS